MRVVCRQRAALGLRSMLGCMNARLYSSAYPFLSEEAEDLIARSYARHKKLSENGNHTSPPSCAIKDLEKLESPITFPVKGFRDRVAQVLVDVLERAMHLFFRDRYINHAVTLETVAAVPGIVAAMHRHLRSLRTMRRDHGWINPLQEEAENERMHLLIWMAVIEPSKLERFFVMAAQGFYVVGYAILYALSASTAHRFVGLLEQCAQKAYTDFLRAIDEGKIENISAPLIAREYYRLPSDATLRDVVLHVRADEVMHLAFNHGLSSQIQNGLVDHPPAYMKMLDRKD
jgi:ubiquinol oxidase